MTAFADDKPFRQSTAHHRRVPANPVPPPSSPIQAVIVSRSIEERTPKLDRTVLLKGVEVDLGASRVGSDSTGAGATLVEVRDPRVDSESTSKGGYLDVLGSGGSVGRLQSGGWIERGGAEAYGRLPCSRPGRRLGKGQLKEVLITELRNEEAKRTST